MYDVVTVAEMREAERNAAAYGLNEDVLIENAAAALYESVISKTERRDAVAIVCGGGNNGADGMSLARKLHLAGRKVWVFVTADRYNAFADARLRALQKLQVPVVRLTDAREWNPCDYALVVDAMLGTGIDRPVEGLTKECVQVLNDSDVFVTAADIPTGIHADTGEVMGCAVVADETVTFSAVKRGHLLGEGRNYCGNLVVADIGVRAAGSVKVCSGDGLRLPARKPFGHKYGYGRVRIVAGSPQMVGASVLACESAIAALKCGAGLVTLCVPDSLRAVYQQRVREATLLFMPDDDGKIRMDERVLTEVTEKTGAIVLGMGMGKNPALYDIVGWLCRHFSGTLVLDADALNAIADDLSVLQGHTPKVILTPHWGEFDRLAPPDGLPLTVRVQNLARKFSCVVAAKSATTVISDGEQTFFNSTGTPAMAKGGSGDVLAGMIGAFACRMPALRATLTACYHFGKLGETAERLYGGESLLPSNLIVR